MVATIKREPNATEPADRVLRLLHTRYVVELRAETMFARMLEVGPLTPGQWRKVEACRLLALQMSGMIWNHLVLELGVETRWSSWPPASTTSSALFDAAVGHGCWTARMAAVETLATAIIPKFRELKALYADKQPALCNTLLAQTLLIRDFAQQESEVESETSLCGVLILLDAGARMQLECLPA